MSFRGGLSDVVVAYSSNAHKCFGDRSCEELGFRVHLYLRDRWGEERFGVECRSDDSVISMESANHHLRMPSSAEEDHFDGT